MNFLDKFIDKRNKNNGQGEMAFTDHLEQLRWHLFRSIVAIIIAAIVVFANIDWVFDKVILGPAYPDFISYKALCKLGEMTNIPEFCLQEIKMKFQNTKLAGQFMISMTSSAMIGFIVAFPYVCWEIWRFIKPALTDKELKYSKGMVFWITMLFLLGVLFAYFIIIPFTINFFANYTLSPKFENDITIADYYDTLFDVILGMGVVFQLPIVIFFLSKIGLITPKLLREKRRYAILIIFVLSAFISPPDAFSLFFIALPLTLLYEVSIIISARITKSIAEQEGKERTLDW